MGTRGSWHPSAVVSAGSSAPVEQDDHADVNFTGSISYVTETFMLHTC